MNIFRLQLMLDLLAEMAVEVPVHEVTGMATSYDWGEVEVTHVIKAFDLNDWTNALEDADQAAPSCGYSACAVGHAMFDNRFIALGLYQHKGCPAYNGLDNWDAVEAFFGISYDSAATLFSPCQYSNEDGEPTTPAEVAQRVQFLLTHGEHELNKQFG